MPAHERLHHRFGERGHLLAHGGARGRGVAVHGEERLRHRHRDLVGLEAHDGTVASHDLVIRISLLRRSAFLSENRGGERGRGMDIGCQTHGELLPSTCFSGITAPAHRPYPHLIQPCSTRYCVRGGLSPPDLAKPPWQRKSCFWLFFCEAFQGLATGSC